MLLEDIKNNWKTDILGYAQVISSLKDTKYPAHTVKLVDGYGVAIPYSGDDVNESSPMYASSAQIILWPHLGLFSVRWY